MPAQVWASCRTTCDMAHAPPATTPATIVTAHHLRRRTAGSSASASSSAVIDGQRASLCFESPRTTTLRSHTGTFVPFGGSRTCACITSCSSCTTLWPVNGRSP
jgi:hypothetical protein